MAVDDGVLDIARAKVDGFRETGAIGPRTEAVLLVGSQVSGWAHASSDYDFVVVAPALPEVAGVRTSGVALDPPLVGTLELPGEPSAECAFWTDSQFDQMLAKVSWERFDSGDAGLLSLTDAEETLLGRLPSAHPVIGSDWLDRRRHDLRSSAYRTFVATRSLSEADGKIEDVAGMLDTGDVESAVLAVQLAFGQTVDALLDSLEVYGSRTPKWRARRLRQAAPSVLDFDTFWSVVTMADFAAKGPEAWVYDVVRLCQSVALDIEL